MIGGGNAKILSMRSHEFNTGMNFVGWSVPNLQDPNGKSTMIGSLIAYQETTYPKYNLWFADFQRRSYINSYLTLCIKPLKFLQGL